MSEPADVREAKAARALGAAPYISASGAKSSKKSVSYHLIPWHIFAARLANRYQLGADTYGEGNWMKGLGDRDYVMERANHFLEHAHAAVEQVRTGTPITDDHIAAAIWGAIFLMAAQQAKVGDAK